MKILIGKCGVDSGLITIIDPCYVDEEFDWGVFCELTYKRMSKEHPWMEWNNGVVVKGFGGDGEYPVYAEVNSEGRVESITIEFRER